MAWETRAGTKEEYYMESYRENGKDKLRYHGRGEAARQAEREALLRRMRRQNAREGREVPLPGEGGVLRRVLRARGPRAMREALQNAGYHLLAQEEQDFGRLEHIAGIPSPSLPA
jgi:hypothetical protein